jgi:trans-2,3-dihydro-3-hydroxyanthranilate isomerase
MRSLAYRIVNVFARSGRLSGNPLCVVEDGSGLDDVTLQAIARQFNVSETTFLFPSSEANARVRIFTPTYEMPFAGHPTLGTAHVVRALGLGGDALSLEMKAGVVPVRAEGDRWTLQARPPQARRPIETRAHLAMAVGLDETDLLDEPLWIDSGTEQLIMPLRSVEAVARAVPAPSFHDLKAEDHSPGAQTSVRPGQACVFHDEGDETGRVTSRFFFPSGAAILEDPATGSACANLGGWFLQARPGREVARVVSQGDAVLRPSTLYLSVRSGSIFVGGDVVELGRGSIAL